MGAGQTNKRDIGCPSQLRLPLPYIDSSHENHKQETWGLGATGQKTGLRTYHDPPEAPSWHRPGSEDQYFKNQCTLAKLKLFRFFDFFLTENAFVVIVSSTPREKIYTTAITSVGFSKTLRNLFLPAVLSAALGAQSLPVYTSPHDQVEAAAAAFSSQSAAPLVSSVFAFPHRLAVPAFASDLLMPSLVAAEEAYWKEASPGIRERDLVKALNSLATKLNLPNYAKTTDSQVRFLRMQLLSASPQFMGIRAFTIDGKGISDYLSPMQALHLSLTLLDQKFWDPKYQVSPTEWEKQVALTNKLQIPPREEGQMTHSIRPHNFPRAKELDDRLRASLGALSDYDGLKMISDILSQLGVL